MSASSPQLHFPEVTIFMGMWVSLCDCMCVTERARERQRLTDNEGCSRLHGLIYNLANAHAVTGETWGPRSRLAVTSAASTVRQTLPPRNSDRHHLCTGTGAHAPVSCYHPGLGYYRGRHRLHNMTDECSNDTNNEWYYVKSKPMDPKWQFDLIQDRTIISPEDCCILQCQLVIVRFILQWVVILLFWGAYVFPDCGRTRYIVVSVSSSSPPFSAK